jgi:hypothetical protein
MLNLPLSVMEAFDAQFERELIRERPREGIVIAMREGKYSCRKHVSDTRDPPGDSQYRQTPVSCINLPPLLKFSPGCPVQVLGEGSDFGSPESRWSKGGSGDRPPSRSP